ncbi:MAG: 2-amino-4-hydroxy-6-hydroxymethyldihydropteridine diphosphokinase [Proteobacteria bacterium]|nr:2-amino-4-hydroxy-6-hydroxymethyldihydropteridine diphosphokinase [Pseudomonadota bacterium]
MQHWWPAWVAVGSNLDDPRRQVRLAFERLGQLPATQLMCRSRLYGSRPLGPVSQPDFVNAVAGLVTQLGAEQLFAALKGIEADMGRPAVHERWGPRVIDLDLLGYARERRADAHLTLPHPGIVERNFVLYPLAEFAPDLDLPGLGRVGELAGRLTPGGLTVLED